MDDARKAVAKLLNQKYLGFLEWILHEITEFIELACGPNLKGEVSAQKKQWSAIHKLREFKNLDYPNDMTREVCEILMQESGNVVWRIVGALQAQI